MSKPFTITFEVTKEESYGFGHSSYFHEYPTGVELLKFIREELKDREVEVDINKVDIRFDSSRLYDLTLPLTLEEVEEVPSLQKLFENGFYARLKVDHRVIGLFCSPYIKEVSELVTKTNVELSYKFDKPKFIEAWMSNGFPQDWIYSGKKIKLKADHFLAEETPVPEEPKESSPLFEKLVTWFKESWN